VKCHDTECDAKCDAKHNTKCARDLISRNPETWILRTNLIFQAAPRGGIPPPTAALGIRHPRETIFRVI